MDILQHINIEKHLYQCTWGEFCRSNQKRGVTWSTVNPGAKGWRIKTASWNDWIAEDAFAKVTAYWKGECLKSLLEEYVVMDYYLQHSNRAFKEINYDYQSDLLFDYNKCQEQCCKKLKHRIQELVICAVFPKDEDDESIKD